MPDHCGFLFPHLEIFMLALSFYLCNLFFSWKLHRVIWGCPGVMNILVIMLFASARDILDVHLMHCDDETAVPKVETTVQRKREYIKGHINNPSVFLLFSLSFSSILCNHPSMAHIIRKSFKPSHI